jgi:hypothetical protein
VYVSYSDRDPFEWDTGCGIVPMIVTAVIARYANTINSIACDAFDIAYKIREQAEKTGTLDHKGLGKLLQRQILLAWDEEVFIDKKE